MYGVSLEHASTLLLDEADRLLSPAFAEELEWLLETHFRAPDGKDHGLHDKITAARDPQGNPLPSAVVRKMRKLVTIRNALVHDREYNAIDDRAAFARGFDEWACRPAGARRPLCAPRD